jgi:hypothetical protein
VEYNKPIGKGVRGASIRFAELALREWANVDSDIYVVYEDDQVRRIKVRVLDAQTNMAFGKEVTIQKTVERRNAADRQVVGERTNSTGQKVYIVLATDDELTNKENALISKALRTEGLRLIPQDLVDEAIETARGTMANIDAQDPQAAKNKIIDAFAGLNVLPAELEKYLGHGLDTVSPSELQGLRAVYATIREGESSWSDYLDQGSRTEIKTEAKLQDLKDRLGVNGKIPAGPAHTWDRKNWINLKRGSFGNFVIANLGNFSEATSEIRMDVVSKWGALYDDRPFPQMPGPAVDHGVVTPTNVTPPVAAETAGPEASEKTPTQPGPPWEAPAVSGKQEETLKELETIFNRAPGYVMNAQKKLGLAVGRIFPKSLEGVVLLLDETLRQINSQGE